MAQRAFTVKQTGQLFGGGGRAVAGLAMVAVAFVVLVKWNAPAGVPAPVGAHELPTPSTAPATQIASPPAVPTTLPASLPSAVLSPSGLPASTMPAGKVAIFGAVPSVIGTDSPQALREAQSRMTAGQYLAARTVLNDVLITGGLSAGDAAAARQMISTLNQDLIFGPRLEPGDPWVDLIKVKTGDILQKLAYRSGTTSDVALRANGMTDARRLRAGQNLKLIKGPFHAVVNKSLFTMDVYLGGPGGPGSLYVTSFAVGLGRDDSTPTGLWVCEHGNKVRNPTYFSPRGEGVIPPGDPRNPLGAYWIALQGMEGQAVGKQSYGIHGTTEPDSIGKQSSMGCIRLAAVDIEQVFGLLLDGKSQVRVVP